MNKSFFIAFILSVFWPTATLLADIPGYSAAPSIVPASGRGTPFYGKTIPKGTAIETAKTTVIRMIPAIAITTVWQFSILDRRLLQVRLSCRK